MPHSKGEYSWFTLSLGVLSLLIHLSACGDDTQSDHNQSTSKSDILETYAGDSAALPDASPDMQNFEAGQDTKGPDLSDAPFSEDIPQGIEVADSSEPDEEDGSITKSDSGDIGEDTDDTGGGDDIDAPDTNGPDIPSVTIDKPIWFLHISDTHIGENPEALPVLETFLTDILALVNPSATIHTGDV